MSTSLRPTTRLSYDQEAVDAFFEKMTRIEGLDEGIRGLTSIDEVRKTFQQMTEGVSGLFDATLKEKVRCARAGQLPTAEGSSYLFEERSQATISRISRTFVEILDGLPPVNRASAAENGFAAEAYQWLSLFQPRHERLFRLKSAIRFFEIGDGPKAKESLKSIVSLFPEQVKEEFSKLIFQETPTPDGLAGLRKGLFDNYRAVASSLVREDRAASAPKRWDDILMNSAFIIPIVGEFTFEELLEGRFPDLEKLPERVLPHGFLYYVQREYTFFPDPSFSTRILAMHPDLTRLGFFAMMKKGSDYALL